MIKVVVDANALMMPFQIKLNLDAELSGLLGDHELLVPKPIVGELERLSATSREAGAALKLAGTRRIMKTQSAGDNSVLELAKKEGAYILSNDKEVIKEAVKEGLKVIRLKEGSHLAIENE